MYSPTEDNSRMSNVLNQSLNWKEFACGWGAAAINVTVTYPINKVLFRQILYGVTMQPAIRQLADEGLLYLYRGMLPPMIQKTLSLSLMFGVYEEIRKRLVDSGFNPYIAKAIGAMTSGTTETILMPFERVQTVLADKKYHESYKNTIHVFKELRKYGPMEYYRGFVPIFFRNGPSNIAFFVIRDEIQYRLPKIEGELLRTSIEFFYGAMIGVVLSGMFYPLNVLKIAMQSQIGGPFQNPIKVLIQVYKERGGKIRYLYYGIQTNCARAFISWGVMTTAYEHIKARIY